MKAGVSVVSRGRRMDVCPAGSSLSCRMTSSGPGHGAGPEARVRGHATVWQTGPSGAINRSGHHVH